MIHKHFDKGSEGVIKKNDFEFTTHLLWTGGWDSTYRLLVLLLIEKRRVQPIYIIDPNRKSVAFEMRAMQKIKKLLKESYPEERELLLPTQFYELNDIEPNDNISNAYKRLLMKYPVLGSQNEWLARMTSQYNITNLEMGLQKSTGNNFKAIKTIIKQSDTNGQTLVKIPEDLKGTDEYYVFGNFSFPLFSITKSGMLKNTTTWGFNDLMNQTWFCHQPLSNGKPCGVCVPCTAIIRDKMLFRMPLYSRIRYHFRYFLSRNQFKKAFPKAHKLSKMIKNKLIIKK